MSPTGVRSVCWPTAPGCAHPSPPAPRSSRNAQHLARTFPPRPRPPPAAAAVPGAQDGKTASALSLKVCAAGAARIARLPYTGQSPNARSTALAYVRAHTRMLSGSRARGSESFRVWRRTRPGLDLTRRTVCDVRTRFSAVGAPAHALRRPSHAQRHISMTRKAMQGRRATRTSFSLLGSPWNGVAYVVETCLRLLCALP
jgi:hypothetical protein